MLLFRKEHYFFLGSGGGGGGEGLNNVGGRFLEPFAVISESPDNFGRRGLSLIALEVEWKTTEHVGPAEQAEAQASRLLEQADLSI